MPNISSEKPVKKIAYEWVVVINNGDEFYLTENQYEYYKNNQDKGKLFFSDFEINPSFVMSAYKRPADAIKDRYPCRKCHTTGYLNNDYEICSDCKGTGINI